MELTMEARLEMTNLIEKKRKIKTHHHNRVMKENIFTFEGKVIMERKYEAQMKLLDELENAILFDIE